MEKNKKRVVAFGPEMPGWGSWEWAGADVARELGKVYSVTTFQAQALPDCDIWFVVKHAPAIEWLDRAARRLRVVYCPVDFYGSAGEIDRDGPTLRRCARILVHCERLRRYFEPYARVEAMDHHVKFAAPLREKYRGDGYIFWVGVRTNLPSVIEWVNQHALPAELRVLTNPEQPGRVPRPTELGFRTNKGICIEEWTRELHTERTRGARAALDIKGQDFRSRHKPPAKAIDFLASGVPLAMNPDSSPVEHLGRMGFEVASPLDAERWLSREYWEETRRFGEALRELLSLERIGLRYKHIIEDVLAER